LSRLSVPSTIHGIEIRDLTESTPNDARVSRLADALDLISAISTADRSLREDLRRIWITQAGIIYYNATLGACLIPAREIESQSAIHLAMTLVQQAKRAHLLRSTKRQPDASIEVAALSEAMAFARAAGSPSEEIVAFRMRHTYNATYTGDPERPFDDLRSLGLPEWAVRVLQRVRRTFPRFKSDE
jgi:hypothetical protein